MISTEKNIDTTLLFRVYGFIYYASPKPWFDSFIKYNLCTELTMSAVISDCV